jgi:hypothetical protein
VSELGECAWTERTNNHWPLRADDFPRGFAETAATIPLLRFVPPRGQLLDLGYDEFLACLEDGYELLQTRLAVVVQRFVNGVQLQWARSASR